jgi:hypothetical protein
MIALTDAKRRNESTNDVRTIHEQEQSKKRVEVQVKADGPSAASGVVDRPCENKLQGPVKLLR